MEKVEISEKEALFQILRLVEATNSMVSDMKTELDMYSSLLQTFQNELLEE